MDKDQQKRYDEYKSTNFTFQSIQKVRFLGYARRARGGTRADRVFFFWVWVRRSSWSGWGEIDLLGLGLVNLDDLWIYLMVPLLDYSVPYSSTASTSCSFYHPLPALSTFLPPSCPSRPSYLDLSPHPQVYRDRYPGAGHIAKNVAGLIGVVAKAHVGEIIELGECRAGW